MNILGISSLDNMSSATLVSDGKIIAAVSEERLTRHKLQAGFPYHAVDHVLRLGGLTPLQIDAVTYPFFDWKTEAGFIWNGFAQNMAEQLSSPLDPKSRWRHSKSFFKWSIEATQVHRRYEKELLDQIRRRGWEQKLQRIEHHQTHAASAYLCAGVDEALVMTLDWYGGGLSGSVSVGRPSGIERIKNFSFPHSLGMFYAYVTFALGFKPARHEGKIVGLAAFGDPNLLYDKVRSRWRLIDGDLRFDAGMDLHFVQQLARQYGREHVAAAYQKVLEDLVSELTAHYVKTTGLSSVVLAGGVAANVKMNQRVHEAAGVKHVFIQPAMGDEGTGTGGALDLAFRKGEVRPFELEHVYLGPEYPQQEMKLAMELGGLAPRYFDHIEDEMARRLAEGEVIAHFDGRMEYGPRALGHRTIFCHPGDPSINDWLNKRLRRTEFMPFAPMTRLDDAKDCYLNLAGAEHTARFMTVTFDCTELMKQHAPAAVHVDGTARPQLVDPVRQPKIAKILAAFRDRTGIPALINTSYNMHEEPIVCTPEDAVRCFKAGGLDTLVLGPYLAELPARAGKGRTRLQELVGKKATQTAARVNREAMP